VLLLQLIIDRLGDPCRAADPCGSTHAAEAPGRFAPAAFLEVWIRDAALK